MERSSSTLPVNLPAAQPVKTVNPSPLAPPQVIWLDASPNTSFGARVWLVSKTSLDGATVQVPGRISHEISLPSSGGAPYVKAFSVDENSTTNLGAPDTVNICTSYSNTEANTEASAEASTEASTEAATCTAVVPVRVAPETEPSDAVWTARRSWTESWEWIFSAWVMHLFRPVASENNKGWHALHDVLRNPTRNFLYNQLGLDEDSPTAPHHVRARADCGDLPYLLRAYFSWKFKLSFRYSECSRGTGREGPVCRGEIDNRTTRHHRESHPVERMNQFLEVITWKVHSGTFRTLPQSDTSDFYPIALDRTAIVPGTVFVDPGGHILMVSQWNDQGLYAVDGHPDKTVTRRPFKPKFFPVYPKLSTGGFKAFRPFVQQVDRWVPMANNTLTPGYSDMQYAFSTKQAFYRAMNQKISRLLPTAQ